MLPTGVYTEFFNRDVFKIGCCDAASALQKIRSVGGGGGGGVPTLFSSICHIFTGYNKTCRGILVHDRPL